MALIINTAPGRGGGEGDGSFTWGKGTGDIYSQDDLMALLSGDLPPNAGNVAYVSATSEHTEPSDGSFYRPFATIGEAVAHLGTPTSAVDFAAFRNIVVLDGSNYPEDVILPTGRWYISFKDAVIDGDITHYLDNAERFGSSLAPSLTLDRNISNIQTGVIGEIAVLRKTGGASTANYQLVLNGFQLASGYDIIVADGVYGGLLAASNPTISMNRMAMSGSGTQINARAAFLDMVDTTYTGNGAVRVGKITNLRNVKLYSANIHEYRTDVGVVTMRDVVFRTIGANYTLEGSYRNWDVDLGTAADIQKNLTFSGHPAYLIYPTDLYVKKLFYIPEEYWDFGDKNITFLHDDGGFKTMHSNVATDSMGGGFGYSIDGVSLLTVYNTSIFTYLPVICNSVFGIGESLSFEENTVKTANGAGYSVKVGGTVHKDYTGYVATETTYETVKTFNVGLSQYNRYIGQGFTLKVRGVFSEVEDNGIRIFMNGWSDFIELQDANSTGAFDIEMTVYRRGTANTQGVFALIHWNNTVQTIRLPEQTANWTSTNNLSIQMKGGLDSCFIDTIDLIYNP